MISAPTTKAELVATNSTAFEERMQDFTCDLPERSREASMDGYDSGSMMPPANLAAYLPMLDELVRKWLNRDDRGDTVEFPETGFQGNRPGSPVQKF